MRRSRCPRMGRSLDPRLPALALASGLALLSARAVLAQVPPAQNEGLVVRDGTLGSGERATFTAEGAPGPRAGGHRRSRGPRPAAARRRAPLDDPRRGRLAAEPERGRVRRGGTARRPRLLPREHGRLPRLRRGRPRALLRRPLAAERALDGAARGVRVPGG